MYSADQGAIEKQMAEMGVQRYRSRVTKAKERNRLATTTAGRYLMREAMTKYVAELDSWLAKATDTGGRNHSSAKYVSMVKTDVIAFVVVKIVLDSVGTQRSYADAAFGIAGALEDELRFKAMIEKAAPVWRDLQKKTRVSSVQHKRKVFRAAVNRLEVQEERWPKRDKLRLGMLLIELLRMSTALIEIRHVKNGKKMIPIISATEETLKWLENAHEAHEALLPFYMPCVDLPLDWDGPYGGGYHSDLLVRRPLIKTTDRAYLREVELQPMPEVYDAINTLQHTAWEVNDYVLAVMEHFWEIGRDVADLPLREDEPLPEKPEDIESNEELRRSWRRMAADTYRRNVAARSNRLQTAKILFMARAFSDKPFFYPYQADFRGRLYCVPYFLQPQGPSQARGLLRFHDGKAITTEEQARWLAIHGANCWGFDKVSMDARRQWVAEHEQQINDVYKDPIDNTWWAGADKPWEFLAFCLEWGAFKETGYGFITKLPIAMDGSNNGLQVFSLLLRDSGGAAATNCTPHDVPRDIYQDVADRVTQKLLVSTHPFARPWLDAVGGRVPRGCCKRPVMTLPYGSTRFSCRKYVEEWYREHARKSGIEVFDGKFFEPCNFLSALVWDSISEIVIAAKACMSWLQDVARVCCEAEIPIRWTSPSGFPVKQSYRKWDTEEIRTLVGETIRWTKFRKSRDELSRRRQVNGISPNFIHSLDAAALVKTVTLAAARGVSSFAMIHDSYGTTCVDADILATSLRDVYAEMFTEDLLSKFASEIQLHLGTRGTVPAVPASGDLDVTQVRNSVYFFA